jgi:hypothetical protein
MSSMTLLWSALGLTTLGFLLLWYGASFNETVLWLGLAVFAIGMLLGPLTRFVASEDSE